MRLFGSKSSSGSDPSRLSSKFFPCYRCHESSYVQSSGFSGPTLILSSDPCHCRPRAKLPRPRRCCRLLSLGRAYIGFGWTDDAAGVRVLVGADAGQGAPVPEVPVVEVLEGVVRHVRLAFWLLRLPSACPGFPWIDSAGSLPKAKPSELPRSCSSGPRPIVDLKGRKSSLVPRPPRIPELLRVSVQVARRFRCHRCTRRQHSGCCAWHHMSAKNGVSESCLQAYD